MTDKGILIQLQQLKQKGQCAFAVLIDPDGVQPASMITIAEQCNKAGVGFVFFGGSLMLSDHVDACILSFKAHSSIPVVLFPGHPSQVSKEADGLLFLSLLSSRNAELLIGQHVIAAPIIKSYPIEVLATGYLVIDGGKPTTVSYMSHSAPIPHNKPDIALCTAWAGEMQGKKVIYMDAGSGAQHPISEVMIEKVAHNIEVPLIIGGGIRSAEKALEICKAGAQVIVVGNAIEQNPTLIFSIASTIQAFNNQK